MELFAQETLARKMVTKGFWLLLLSFLAAPAGYIVRILISNDLSVDQVGIFYSVIGLITIFLAY